MRYVLTIGGSSELDWRIDPQRDGDDPRGDLRRWQRRAGEAGALVAVVPLRAPETATTLRFHGRGFVVCDEPCVPERDAVVAYAVIEAEDLDRALALVRTWTGGGYIEVRPMSGDEE